MTKAKFGDTVKIHFEGKLEEGQVFDTTLGEEPYEMTIGDQDNLPELEKAILGMEIGDTKEIVLTPEKGYGHYDDSLIIPIPRNSLPGDFSIEEGEEFIYENDKNEVKRVTLVRKDEENLYFDFNHPLAGKTVTYKILLNDIVS